MKILKKYCVKIPNNIEILYNFNKNFIVFIGPLGQKSLKLKLKLLIDNFKKLIYVSNIFVKDSHKIYEGLQGVITAILKHKFLEICILLCSKLTLIGVGYKVFLIENAILHFKLGFSHEIFFKLFFDIKILSFLTNLYIFGNSFDQIRLIASVIRSNKIPDLYKGKGILYKNEKLNLKKGKKI